MPMGVMPTNVPNPTIGLEVTDRDDPSHTAIVTSIIRYNGEGKFVCGLHSNKYNDDYQQDIWYESEVGMWFFRHYRQENRFPDYDGTVKNM